MKVLAVASEVYPLVKTGGLADVVGALPGALAKLKVGITTFVPGYPSVLAALENPKQIHATPSLFGGSAKIVAAKVKGLDLFVLDAPHLFNRPGNIYLGPDGKDWPDNAQRYAALSSAAADVARGAISGYAPDVVHLHDWQAGLAAAYLKFHGGPPCVMTVHNLAFQGHYPASLFPSLGLPPAAFGIAGVEYYGGVGYLKAGLALANAITTVSPTYAREIQTPQDGMGLDGLLQQRSLDVHGVLNGIDTDVWNPETDKALAKTYGVKSLAARAANKRALERRFGLRPGDGILYCIISRLTGQKGMDLVAPAADGLIAAGARLAVLGSGDAALEALFKAAAAKHQGAIGVVTAYDEPLSHQMQAGADAILIPSRFEPCGLTQLYGLRYGCVPIVARVGGLADTLVDANDAAVGAGVATGFQFAPVTQGALEHALWRASQLFADNKAWAAMQKAGMSADVSWDRSAQRYANLYKAVAP